MNRHPNGFQYIAYANKVEHFRKCERCDGRGSILHEEPSLFHPDLGEIMMGTYEICRRCVGGYHITYPWTRGKSLTPIVARASR